MSRTTCRSDQIKALLVDTFAPSHLLLIDESAKHKGHKGVLAMTAETAFETLLETPTETHFALEIAATKLNGLSRVQQHQLIYDAVADQFKAGLHSLRIKVL
jgi:BolA protein